MHTQLRRRREKKILKRSMAIFTFAKKKSYRSGREEEESRQSDQSMGHRSNPVSASDRGVGCTPPHLLLSCLTSPNKDQGGRHYSSILKYHLHQNNPQHLLRISILNTILWSNSKFT